MMYLMGSTYFFGKYDDFKSHDIDYIEVIDTNEFKSKRVIKFKGKDIIQIKKRNKNLIISDALKEKLGFCIGKFLIPEFNKEIKFTIEDLPKVKPLLDRLDDKHLYEKIIYDAYITNGDFYLTEKQRKLAYECYKQERGI